MADKEVAIQVSDLTKMYKLYDKPSDRLKEALGLSRKKKYKEHLNHRHKRVRKVYDSEDHYRCSDPHLRKRDGEGSYFSTA